MREIQVWKNGNKDLDNSMPDNRGSTCTLSVCFHAGYDLQFQCTLSDKV